MIGLKGGNMSEGKFSYQNMLSFFDELHRKKITYAVLRNYDNILEDEIYQNGHGDVDLLCENGYSLAAAIKAYPHKFHIKKGKADGVHYYIYVNENYVSLDLRYVGDGYYCEKWQKDMLERRCLFNGFYVLSAQDYFYSLIYHAVFQKEKFSDEYRNRLSKMAKDLGLELKRCDEIEFVELLELFMKENDYHYLYSKDYLVPFRAKLIQDHSLMRFNFLDFLKHKQFDLKVKFIANLVRIKHKIENRKND